MPEPDAERQPDPTELVFQVATGYIASGVRRPAKT